MANVEEILSYFALDGRMVSATPYGNGHINDTYRIVTQGEGGVENKYLLQRINHAVFRKPKLVMENISRCLTHLKAKAASTPDVQTMTVIPTKEGRSCIRTFDGKWWRVYDFLDGLESYDNVQDPDIVYEAARGFAQFQNMVADMPLPRLHETIPYFHHTPMRYATLEEAIYSDIRDRAHEVEAEIEFVRARKHLVAHLLNRYLRGQIPERITHNDTKINNALFDPETKRCTAVVDLDTVMPGLALYDFGDMCRTTCNPAAEDEKDLSKVIFDLKMFEAACSGYMETARFLTPAEIQELDFSAWLLPFMVGIRFLTDYLQGDVYFKTHYPKQNVDRCRTQFCMAARIEACREEMQAIVQRCAKATGHH